MDTAAVAARAPLATVRVPVSLRTVRVLASLCVTAVLVAALLGVTAYLDTHANDVDSVVDWASTNLHNLAGHPVASLVTSMFVVPGYPIVEAVLLAAGCAVVERALGSRRALLIAFAGQVIATLVTEYGAALASNLQLVATSSSHRIDVGVSYAMFALLGAAAFVSGPRWRLPLLATVLGVVVVALAVDPGMTTTGHVLSVVCGVAVAWWCSARPAGALAARPVRADRARDEIPHWAAQLSAMYTAWLDNIDELRTEIGAAGADDLVDEATTVGPTLGNRTGVLYTTEKATT